MMSVGSRQSGVGSPDSTHVAVTSRLDSRLGLEAWSRIPSPERRVPSPDCIQPMSTASPELKQEVKQALVRSLRLPIPPEEIGDSMPLFGEGLGLDSIDVLELVLELERSFGVSITDEQTGTRVLRSVDAIADFIAAERNRSST
jgi:acyl carrier protein